MSLRSTTVVPGLILLSLPVTENLNHRLPPLIFISNSEFSPLARVLDALFARCRSCAAILFPKISLWLFPISFVFGFGKSPLSDADTLRHFHTESNSYSTSSFEVIGRNMVFVSDLRSFLPLL